MDGTVVGTAPIRADFQVCLAVPEWRVIVAAADISVMLDGMVFGGVPRKVILEPIPAGFASNMMSGASINL